MSSMRRCTIDWCEKAVKARGLCGWHYELGRRGVTPRRPPTIAERIEANVVIEPNSGCWLWVRSVNVAGYGQMHVGVRPHLVHRLAYEAFVGPIPDSMHVCHRCDVPPCCNPDHLFLGTRVDNMRDMAAKGRASTHIGRRGNAGGVNPMARVTASMVDEIRAGLSRGLTRAAIAREVGLHRNTVAAIANGKHWAA